MYGFRDGSSKSWGSIKGIAEKKLEATISGLGLRA